MTFNQLVPTNHPVPFTLTIDCSHTSHFRLCQQHYRKRALTGDEADDPLPAVPTVTVSGRNYDIRTLTAKQVDLLQLRGCLNVSKEDFLQAGLSGNMYQDMTTSEIMRALGVRTS